MTSLGAAYDNIRLLRRKIAIAEEQLVDLPHGSHRDEVVMQVSNLTHDLVRALHDFADMGYEEDVARAVSAPMSQVIKMQQT